MTAEDTIARQHRKALGFVHTETARKRGELQLHSVGWEIVAFADYHIRRDRQMTIYAIAAVRIGQGYGRHLLGELVSWANATDCTCIVARCPVDLPSNGFWLHMGFQLVDTKPASGKKRAINTYRLELGGK